MAIKENQTLAPRTISEYIKAAYENAARHGFWDNPPSFRESVDRIKAELDEAIEAYESGMAVNEIYRRCKAPGRMCTMCGACNVVKPEGVPIELADAVILILSLCGHDSIDLEAALHEKMAHNLTRPYLHGQKPTKAIQQADDRIQTKGG